MEIINVGLISHPMNWIILLVMVILATYALNLILQLGKSTYEGTI